MTDTRQHYAQAFRPWSFPSRFARSIGACVLLLMAACQTTETVDASSIIEPIPEVALVTTLDTLSKADADRLRDKLTLRYPRAVYETSIVPVYWRDATQVDIVLFVSFGSDMQVLKVSFSRWRHYRVTSGTRNGKPFHTEGLLSERD